MKNKNKVVDFRPKVETGAIAHHMKAVLAGLGEDPEREGLLRTPERVREGIAVSDQRLRD